MGLHRAKDSLSDLQDAAKKAMSCKTLSIATEHEKKEQQQQQQQQPRAMKAETRTNGTTVVQQQQLPYYWESGDDWSAFEILLPLQPLSPSSSSSSSSSCKRSFREKEQQKNERACFPCFFPWRWSSSSSSSIFVDIDGNDDHKEEQEENDVGFVDEEEALVIDAAWKLKRTMEHSAIIDENCCIDEKSSSSSSSVFFGSLQQQQQQQAGGLGFERSSNSKKKGGGIMKRTSIVQQIYLGVDFVRRKTFAPLLYHHPENNNDSTTHSKLHNYAGGNDLYNNPKKERRRVHFRPVINAVPIRSHKDMAPNEKWDVWWQLLDFERFKTKIKMLSNEQEPIHYERFSSTTLEDDDNNDHDHDNDDNDDNDDDDNVNWWHKHGESRRGAEKCAYGHEAQEAMEFAKRSVAVVVQKQKQQQRHLDDAAKEEEGQKLAVLYHEHSAWATDLALAWAASDADAVKTNFDKSKRKSREFYLLKQLMKHQQKIHKHSPSFMIPKGIPTKGYR